MNLNNYIYYFERYVFWKRKFIKMSLTLTDFFHKYKFKLLLILFILISVRYVFYNEY